MKVMVLDRLNPEGFPVLDNATRSFLLSSPTYDGTDEGKRVRFPRGPAAVTGATLATPLSEKVRHENLGRDLLGISTLTRDSLLRTRMGRRGQ